MCEEEGKREKRKREKRGEERKEPGRRSEEGSFCCCLVYQYFANWRGKTKGDMGEKERRDEKGRGIDGKGCKIGERGGDLQRLFFFCSYS